MRFISLSSEQWVRSVDGGQEKSAVNNIINLDLVEVVEDYSENGEGGKVMVSFSSGLRRNFSGSVAQIRAEINQ